MQDFNYLFSNCLELTAELSCWKRPPTSHLQTEWENNLEPMLVVLESVHTGVKGKVIVAETGEPLERSTVEVIGCKLPPIGKWGRTLTSTKLCL